MKLHQLAVTSVQTCPLCGNQGDILHADIKDCLYGVPGVWQTRRCQDESCGLLWLDPMPTADTLYLAYQNYFTHPKKSEKQRSGGIKVFFARRGRRLIHHMTGLSRERAAAESYFLQDARPGKLLEVGCGSGKRLAHLRSKGWRVEGQEVDPAAAEVGRALGETIHLGSLESLNLAPQQFDVIVMSHVIEHVLDPVGLLMQCRRLLLPGGLLVALTPNSRGLLHQSLGRHYFGLDAPRHLHLFHPVLLERCAQKAGFSKSECKTTNARLDYMAVASLNIAASGVHSMADRPEPFRYFAATCFQVWAQYCLASVPESGEECVLKAWL